MAPSARPLVVCLKSQTTESLIDQFAPDRRPPSNEKRDSMHTACNFSGMSRLFQFEVELKGVQTGSADAAVTEHSGRREGVKKKKRKKVLVSFMSRPPWQL